MLPQQVENGTVIATKQALSVSVIRSGAPQAVMPRSLTVGIRLRAIRPRSLIITQL